MRLHRRLPTSGAARNMVLAVLLLVSGLAREALAQAPPPPPQYSPSGSIMNPTPTYRWGAVSGANQYYLQISNSTAPVFSGFYFPANCSAGTCSATPGITLPVGPYTWYVQAQGPGGKTWSAGMAFTVIPPPAPTLSSPSGPTYTPTPTYTWSTVAGATQYALEVDSATARIFQTTYPAASVCSGATCSATPSTSLTQGSYTWLAQARNASGGTWSAPKGFTVQGPPAPTPQAPTGTGTNATPTYKWSAVGGSVTYYVLSVTPVDGGTAYFTVNVNLNACAGGTCSATPPNVLRAGSYTWQVRGWNTTGVGDLSNPMAFTVTGPPIPNPLSPSGVLTTPVPTFSWNAVGGNVILYNLGVSKANLSVYEDSFDPSVCVAGTCSVTPNHVLAQGSYTWAVRGRNAAGPGGWSNPMAFSIQPPAPPTPLAPTGKVPTQTPTFSWNVSTGAMGYTLSVLNENGSTLYEWGASTGACTNGVCSVTPTGVLGVGVPYRWRVRGQHPAGIGDWSALLDFHVASLDDCDLEFVTGDFDGNGITDGLCQTQGDVYVALGDGAGRFGVARVWLVHVFARLLFGDFDGDGKTDLADVNVQTGDFLVARSTGSNFAPLTSWGIAKAKWGGTSYVCQGDSLIAGADRFDADPRTDVYCRDSSLKFFLGISTGTAFVFSILDDPPPAYVPVQEYIYAGPRPLAITGAPRQ
jgi:hypothetical protein